MLHVKDLAKLPPESLEGLIRGLSPAEVEQLAHCWRFWARPEQIAPPVGQQTVGGLPWSTFLVLAGRGFGKTRLAAEMVREEVESGRAKRIALVGRTVADVRDVMVRGQSGLLSCYPPSGRPNYIPSRRVLIWKNGATATTFSAEKPDQLRGPQFDFAWADEIAAWQHADTWTQLQYGLRLGNTPRVVATTTPKPLKWLRKLIDDPTTIVRRGSTFDNIANLAPPFIRRIRAQYEGTRLGRQELFAEMLDDAPGALWQRAWLDQQRIVGKTDPETGQFRLDLPPMLLVVIGVDPAVTTGENANETGIVVVGLGEDGHGYVLEDGSGHYTPERWAAEVARLYVKWGAARVVAEVNQGGDLVESTLKAVRLPGKRAIVVHKVHASRGKRTRAEPVAAIYEQGRVHHVGYLSLLEDQLCSWEPDVVVGEGLQRKVQRSESPDRLDALVHALTNLMVERGARDPVKHVPVPRVRSFDRTPAAIDGDGIADMSFDGIDDVVGAHPGARSASRPTTADDIMRSILRGSAGGQPK